MLVSMEFWIGVVVGGALIWYGKATIQKMFSGAGSVVSTVEADVSAIKAKITPASAPAPAPVTTKSS